MKFIIKKTKSGKYWYFILKARNGNILVTSAVNQYETKQACKKGVNAVRKSMFAKVIDLSIEK